MLNPRPTLIAALCLSALAADNSADAPIPFPEGFRRWTHLHSTVIGPKHGTFNKKPCEKPCTGGIFHFYANAKAMEGLRTGVYEDGAVFADEVFETVEVSPNAFKVGVTRGVGVMIKDGKRYRDTGGWGFASYEGNGKTDSLDQAGKVACFQCHTSKKDRDFVFTVYRER